MALRVLALARLAADGSFGRCACAAHRWLGCSLARCAGAAGSGTLSGLLQSLHLSFQVLHPLAEQLQFLGRWDSQAAQSTAEGASNTQVSSQELARMAQALQRLVDEYRK